MGSKGPADKAPFSVGVLEGMDGEGLVKGTEGGTRYLTPAQKRGTPPATSSVGSIRSSRASADLEVLDSSEKNYA